MTIGYAIWFIVVVVVRAVVLSLRGVEELGFAAYPDFFGGGAYPLGLLWLQVIDVAFRTVLLFSLLSLGGRLREVLDSTFPRVPRLGRMGYLAAVTGALIVGYFAYAPVVMQPLATQRAEWAYKVVFWASLVGVITLAAYELARMMSTTAARDAGTVSLATPSSAAVRAGESTVTCAECSAPVSPTDRYCSSCGTCLEESQTHPEARDMVTPPTESTKTENGGSRASAALLEEALKGRVVRLMRSTAAGATAKHMLSQFLEIDREYEPYKALLVTFTATPPEVKKTSFLGVPVARPLEATALEVISAEELRSWDRMTVEGLVILTEPSQKH
jgi:uncharacterized low-complexity protein